MKRAFQDFVNKLEKTYRDEERVKKQELQKKVDDLSVFLRADFEKLGVDGVLTPTCRWKDWVKRPEVTENPHYKEIELLVGGGQEKDKDREKGEHPERDRERDRGERSDRAEKSDSITAGMASSSRNVFEDAVDAIKEAYKQDRRLIKDVLDDKDYTIEHDSTYEEYSAVLLAAAGVKAVVESDPIVEGQKQKEKDDVAKPVKIDEKSEKKKEKDFQNMLWNMLDNRPKYPLLYFTEVHDDVLAVYEQERERQKRKEDKYITLLEDFYNRSDHVGTQWEDAKLQIGKYPEYSNLGRNDRKRIFTEYMTELEGIMKLKTKSLHDSMIGEVERIVGDSKEDTGTGTDEGGKRAPEKEERDTEGGERRDAKRHRSDSDKDENREREHRGREKSRGDDDRDKDRDRDQKGRDREKHRSDRDADGRKRERDRDDKEDEEGEEDEDDEGDDDDGKKGKKHKKQKSSRDKAEKEKKHKKVRAWTADY